MLCREGGACFIARPRSCILLGVEHHCCFAVLAFECHRARFEDQMQYLYIHIYMYICIYIYVEHAHRGKVTISREPHAVALVVAALCNWGVGMYGLSSSADVAPPGCADTDCLAVYVIILSILLQNGTRAKTPNSFRGRGGATSGKERRRATSGHERRRADRGFLQ